MVLITGSNTFLGEEVTKYFTSKNIQIRTFEESSGCNQASCQPSQEYNIISPALTEIACSGVGTIIHLLDEPEKSKLGRSGMRKINIDGTINLLKSAASNGVGHFILLSTYMVYKRTKSFPINEEHPLKPWTDYGKDKLIAEKTCINFCKKHGIRLTIIRPSIIKGPNINNSVILHTLFMAMGLGNDNICYITGNGDNRIQFLSREDAADAIYRIYKSHKLSMTDIFNIGSDKVPSQLEQIIKIKETEKLDFAIKRISFWKAYFYHLLLKPTNTNFFTKEYLLYLFYTIYLDCDRIKNTLNWYPKKKNAEILSETVQWYERKLNG